MIILFEFFSDENCYVFGPLWLSSVDACSRSVSTCSRTLAWGPLPRDLFVTKHTPVYTVA